MVPLTNAARLLFATLLLCLVPPGPAQASPAQASPAQPDSRPLPDISLLMQQVEANQKTSEATIRNYLYTSTITSEELNGHGDAKKTETTEREVFYIDATRLERTTRRNGKDLTPEEQRKEAERIDKAIARAKQRQAGNEAATSGHRQTVTFARFLELGSFSNERRVQLHGRSTIALDYAGDPKAKTRNALEGVIHDLVGTVWVDEQQSALSRVEGHFLSSFKVAGGLIFSVSKDTAFSADWTPVNGEVWLPSTFTANGSLRALLFISFNGRASGVSHNYRRFKANATILPGTPEVTPQTDAPPQTEPHPPSPNDTRSP